VRGRRPRRCLRLRRFGDTIGWHSKSPTTFWTSKNLPLLSGKTAGKDLAQQKATYPAVYGLERSSD